jgi:hypothetical protein
MAYGYVYVKGPAGRDVYVNGGYAEPNGKTNAWFTVEYGVNLFQTLNGHGDVDLEARCRVGPDDPQQEVDLGLPAGED